MMTIFGLVGSLGNESVIKEAITTVVAVVSGSLYDVLRHWILLLLQYQLQLQTQLLSTHVFVLSVILFVNIQLVQHSVVKTDFTHSNSTDYCIY